jgi:hypothetical protein
MKISFKNTKEQIELVQAMASRDRSVALAAQESIAKFMSKTLAEVVNTAPTLSNLFSRTAFAPDENPSWPVDLFSDITDEDFIKVYSQSVPGGLPTNEMVVSSQEMKMHIYTLDSAWSFDSKYARRSRMDVVAKTFERMMQEILLKQEKTSASMLMGTLADNAADSNANPESNPLVQGASATLLPADLNKLLVRVSRVGSSWNSGTPEVRRGSITDLIMSPERVADIRAMAYNPINTVANDQTVAAGEDSGITLPDSMRSALFGTAGINEFMGLPIREINELGVGQKYTNVFRAAFSGTFNAADDLVLALDMTKDALLRGVAVDPDMDSEINIQVDDQFVARQKKIGWYLNLDEGRLITDWRAIYGLRIAAANA